ncbi:hypothetical protein ACHAP5_011997 [Fusarium lateritium]
MASADHADDFKKEFTAMQKPMTQLHGAFMQKHLDSAARVGEPSGGKFTYPYSKRRTKETVDALRQAEANLDMFWAKVDDVTKARVTDFQGTALYRLLSQPRTLRRTGEWVEPVKKSEKVESSLEKDIWALDRPMSNLFLGESEQTGQSSSPRSARSRNKVKTKGEASQTSNNSVDAQPAVASNAEKGDNQPTFAVDARVLKVFRTLRSSLGSRPIMQRAGGMISLPVTLSLTKMGRYAGMALAIPCGIRKRTTYESVMHVSLCSSGRDRPIVSFEFTKSLLMAISLHS